MIPRTSRRRKYGVGLLIIFLLIVSFSFNYSYNVKEGGPFRSFQSFRIPVSGTTGDTIPGERKSEGSALDDQSLLDKELNTRSIEKALRNVEDRLKKLETELRDRDWDKVQHAYRKAINDVNWKQVEADTRQALADVNKKLILENNIYLHKIKLQIDQAKAIAAQNLKEMQISIDHDLKINLQNATQSLQKAQTSLQWLEAFANDLKKDGLIEDGKPYSVEIKDGDLYINDVKQSKKVTKKYREKYKEYFENNGGDFKIHSNKRKEKQGDGEVI